MKRLFCLAAAIILALSAVTVQAAKVGDSVGEVVYTDIAAYINHYPISAYAYDGGMVVVAEDLRDYGFDVSYDDSSRSLSITPAQWMTTLAGKGAAYTNGARKGKYFSDALYSDINVYFNGSWIPSCAINGYMMVKLEDLASESAGTSFTWDNDTRSARLWLDWAAITEYKAQPAQPFAEKIYLDQNGCGSAWYDVDFDGVLDKVEMRQSRSVANDPDGMFNMLKAELIVKGQSYLIENAYKTHGCGAIFVADTNQNDNMLDIIVLTEYKGTSAGIFRYKNGLVSLGSVSVGGFNEVTEPEYAAISVNNTLWQSPGFSIVANGKTYKYTTN